MDDDLPAQVARLTAENAALRATVRRQARDLADAQHTVYRLAVEINEIGRLVRGAHTDGDLRALFYQRWRVAHSTPPRPAPPWMEAQRAAEAAGEADEK